MSVARIDAINRIRFFNFQAIVSIVFERLFVFWIQILIKHEFRSNNKYTKQIPIGLNCRLSTHTKNVYLPSITKWDEKWKTFVLQVQNLNIW